MCYVGDDTLSREGLVVEQIIKHPYCPTSTLVWQGIAAQKTVSTPLKALAQARSARCPARRRDWARQDLAAAQVSRGAVP
jgi:hypothetical protein